MVMAAVLAAVGAHGGDVSSYGSAHPGHPRRGTALPRLPGLAPGSAEGSGGGSLASISRRARPPRSSTGRGGLTASTPRHIVSRYPYCLSICRRVFMLGNRLGTWRRWLRITATFVFIAALCLAVAMLVIALIPGSPVTQELPDAALTGLDRVGGVTTGVAVNPSGWIPFTIHDPSL